MSICSNCGAEIRPGDNFCLSCGNRIPTPSSTSFPTDDATVLGSPASASDDWSGGNESTIPDQDVEEATVRANADPGKIENPARFVLSANRGNDPKEYSLEKDTSIGRAPENDIVLLDEEKVISRYHAVVRYG